ncbi:MAG: SIMPL domain-containing protein [bacterium]|nr:SIMPL domain-containing protein [bacterium]
MTTENNMEGHTCGGCGGGWHHHGKKGAFMLLAIAGALYLFALAANTIAEYRYIGRDMPGEQTTISVTGDGEAYAAPDIATVSFAITNESKQSTEARKVVDEKMKKIHDFLTASGVLEKDIKTTGYNLSPKYEWQEQRIVCVTYPCNQPPGKQVLTGYEVTQSVEVKIRKLDDAGKVLGGLSDNGATNVSGLSFLVENEDAVQREAREEAITKAKTKAEELAKDLGVSLVRIVSFNEGGNYPIYYGRAEMKLMSADAGASVAADIPAGENKYTSNVTIVYEIR